MSLKQIFCQSSYLYQIMGDSFSLPYMTDNCEVCSLQSELFSSLHCVVAVSWLATRKCSATQCAALHCTKVCTKYLSHCTAALQQGPIVHSCNVNSPPVTIVSVIFTDLNVPHLEQLYMNKDKDGDRLHFR